MSYANQGGLTNLRYDDCAYSEYLDQSVSPFAYQMFNGKFENKNRCVYDIYPQPFNGRVVDAESELIGLPRRATKCPSRQYNPTCKSKICTNTFDKSVPVILAPEVCPIIDNNLKWKNGTGLRMPIQTNCKGINWNTKN